MKRIDFSFCMNYENSANEDFVEAPKDCSEEEIDEAIKDAIMGWISYWRDDEE